MDAPPDKEDCRPFVRVARMLADAGVHAPQGPRAGPGRRDFCCFPTWATRTYLAELNAGNAAQLFADATDALLRWQLATRAGELPPYDEALLRREMSLFPEWYVGKHLKKRCRIASADPWKRPLRPPACRARSRSPWSTCTATTCRAT